MSSAHAGGGGDVFGTRGELETRAGRVAVYRLSELEQQGVGPVSQLPYSIRTLLESVLRHCDGRAVRPQDVRSLAQWAPAAAQRPETPFKPARVLLQDFTGVPAVVDLAALRSAMERLGGDPSKVNPLIPADLVIDHSVQIDYFGDERALERNVELEFQRNRERYEFLRWGQHALKNFRVIPPNVGIVHQVNLEHLARVVCVGRDAHGDVAYPDTLVGTDSHTTMINGLGVVGWGVGGIEAEAAMLGQPVYLLAPDVVGFELVGRLPEGATATDAVLTITEILRREGVVGKFVEYFGEGAAAMSLADRATIANMAPEYGATMGFFPVDDETLCYLRQTGRSEEHVDLVERYMKEQGLFRSPDSPTPRYTNVLRLDLGQVVPSLAGPKRPQDRVPLDRMKESFRRALRAPVAEGGFGLDEAAASRRATVSVDGRSEQVGHGAVVIAAITSCTNTSNPSVMLAAGLLAKKAAERGLRPPAHVKTSLAPGSRAVTDYLAKTGLLAPLQQLGFHVAGYGCTTCIGNSGPLPAPVAQAIRQGELVAAAVLSGNRNFEGRVNPLVKANYLASPPLVVAYALAGSVDVDLARQPLGRSADGQPVYLRDVWPSGEEIAAAAQAALDPDLFRREYAEAIQNNPRWNAIQVEAGQLYRWRADSTYIQEPPFVRDIGPEPAPLQPIRGARPLLVLGDSITTDHISPAGPITQDSPAGRYLMERGVDPKDFNTYGSRRGNDQVMVRGTFANIRIRNQLVPGVEGGWTRHFPDGEQMTVFEAAMKYREEGVPLVVLAGAEYGTGSSRDWAAKGTQMLGVRAVLAASFERIHRSNLVGMGVLPLQFPEGQTWRSLGLTGEETFDIEGLDERMAPGQELPVRAVRSDGRIIQFAARSRIDTPVELDYYRHGGILPAVLRKLLAAP